MHNNPNKMQPPPKFATLGRSRYIKKVNLLAPRFLPTLRHPEQIIEGLKTCVHVHTYALTSLGSLLLEVLNCLPFLTPDKTKHAESQRNVRQASRSIYSGAPCTYPYFTQRMMRLIPWSRVNLPTKMDRNNKSQSPQDKITKNFDR